MNKPVPKQKAKSARKSSRVSLMASTVVAGILLVNIEAPVRQAQAQNAPIFENITLSPKFSPDPQIIRGISGGAVPAKTVAGRTETVTGPCAGFVDEKPDHTLQLTAFFEHLSLVVESPEDTTILITGPGGTWCNDDYQAKNSGISGQWLPGTYQVWVGSYDKTKFLPYVIKVSEVR